MRTCQCDFAGKFGCANQVDAQGSSVIVHSGRRTGRTDFADVEGDSFKTAIRFEVFDMICPILSVGKLIRRGARLVLEPGRCELIHNGRRNDVLEQDGVFRVRMPTAALPILSRIPSALFAEIRAIRPTRMTNASSCRCFNPSGRSRQFTISHESLNTQTILGKSREDLVVRLVPLGAAQTTHLKSKRGFDTSFCRWHTHLGV